MRRLGGLEGDSSTGELSPSNCGRIARGCRPGRRGIEGVAVQAPDTLRAGGPLGELPCAPPAPHLHARFSEPRKGQQPWWPTRARPSAQMATTGGVALRALGPAPPRPVLRTGKRQPPWWPTRARPSAQMALPAAPASMDAPRHLFPAAVLTASAPAVANRYTIPIRKQWVEGPLELWSHRATAPPHRPVQRRRVTTTFPRATR